ncbi:tail fiber protein [Pseudomonas phage Henninger]|uniref:Tail fiber protein n=1 Tax=Pseudomonas phage Henninger TaxID=2079287 RepID=A0A2K9VH98_9CAUD|nr:tail fiber protein [Pseudomonas phage Henninger]AUV61700.1 tail fiber protein [Pseudomonas phage Henninger]
MATTPKTVRTYPINSVTKDFTIPFEYLARKFVVVTLIGATRRELILNTEYRFSTATTITTTKAWGPSDNFTLIEIRRLTSATERLVDFADGSILRAYDLNISSVQSLHIAEEARDLTADTIGVNNDGNLDARARKIVNLADGTDDGDAVNLRQQKQWAGSALNQAQAAAASAQASAASAAAALASANASAGSASSSLTYSQNSANSASASQTSRLASETAKTASEAARDLAQLWSSKQEDVAVSGGSYSALHWASKAAKSATAAATSATNSATSATQAAASVTAAQAQADRAKTEADKLGNMNALGGALDGVSSTVNVTWKGQHFFRDGVNIQPLTTGGDSSLLFRNYAQSWLGRFHTNDAGDFVWRDETDNFTRMRLSKTALGVAVPVSINGTITAQGAQVNGAINSTAAINSNTTVAAKGGTLQVYAAATNSNAHVWFYNADGATRGILYGGTDGAMYLATASKTFSFDNAGNTSFPGNGYYGNGLAVYAPSFQTTFYKTGVGSGSSMYGNCQLQLQAQDGSLPALGFHSAGRYAAAMFLNTDNNFYMSKNSGVTTLMLTTELLGGQIGGNITANAVGTFATMQNASGTAMGPDSVVAGSGLKFSSHNAVSTITGAGSWRCHGNGNTGGVAVWCRYA